MSKRKNDSRFDTCRTLAASTIRVFAQQARDEADATIIRGMVARGELTCTCAEANDGRYEGGPFICAACRVTSP